MMPRALLVTLILLLSAGEARAGAWTQQRDHFAVFAGTTISTASRRFDYSGDPSIRVMFNKIMLQNWMEYGLSDSVTLFAVPSYVFAQAGLPSGAVTFMESGSVEAGTRIRLFSNPDVLSVQASAKTAGAFDMSVSSSGEAGRQFEVRLLYGHSFKLARLDGYVDMEVARRWIARPRSDELVVEGTAGLKVTSEYHLLFQLFTFFTDGEVRPPYESYAMSKMQVSLVQLQSRRWAVQTGYFFTIGGRNIIKERGMICSIWFQA